MRCDAVSVGESFRTVARIAVRSCSESSSRQRQYTLHTATYRYSVSQLPINQQFRTPEVQISVFEESLRVQNDICVTNFFSPAEKSPNQKHHPPAAGTSTRVLISLHRDRARLRHHTFSHEKRFDAVETVPLQAESFHLLAKKLNSPGNCDHDLQQMSPRRHTLCTATPVGLVLISLLALPLSFRILRTSDRTPYRSSCMHGTVLTAHPISGQGK